MDTSNLEKNPLWFVASAYTVGGTPKAEDATMSYARKEYLHTMIPDYMIPEVVKDIEAYRDRLLQENRRLSTVNVSFHTGYTDDIRYIFVGRQSLHLIRLKKVIE
jgi:hypothetical protein